MYSVVLIAGLIASVVWRRKLGAAGFALLVVADLAPLAVVDLAPVAGDGGLSADGRLPGVADLPPGLIVGEVLLLAAYAAGIALLVAAVVRRGRPD
ncbi:hypothetical protein ACQPZJ_37650 [Actinoplanes sp. CA-054009]